jgi:hypothetical protein
MVLHQCTDEFRNIFWECCAALLNYFADFLSTDNTKNKIIWFHMLNVFQDAAVLPHNFNSTQFPSCDHAEAFAREYEESLKLMNDVIMADDFLRDDVVHRSIGLTEPATYQTGPWMNGMKPWDQYLMADSPGLDVPIGDREYPEGVKAPDTEAKKDADAEENEEPEVGFGQQLGRQETGVIRCVPSGGLAIVQKHTDTARILGAHYAANDDEIDQDAFIAEFDNNVSPRLSALLYAQTRCNQP